MGHWAGRDRLVMGLPSWDAPAREQPSPVFQIPSSDSTGTELFIAGEELCSVRGGTHPESKCRSQSRPSNVLLLSPGLHPARASCPPPQLLLPPQPFTLFLIFKIVVKDA